MARYLILPAELHCITLYVYCFALGILIDLIMNNYNRNRACFNEYQ